MGLIDFLKSKYFKQLLLSVIALFLLCFILMRWLAFRTNHGEEITVPDISKLTIVQAKREARGSKI